MRPCNLSREPIARNRTGWFVLAGFVLGVLAAVTGGIVWIGTGHRLVLTGHTLQNKEDKEQVLERARIEEKHSYLAYWETRLTEQETRLKGERKDLEKMASTVQRHLAVISDFEQTKDIGLGRTWAAMNPEEAARIMDHMSDETLLPVLMDVDPYHRGKILGSYAGKQDGGQQNTNYAERAARLTDQLRKILDADRKNASGKQDE